MGLFEELDAVEPLTQLDVEELTREEHARVETDRLRARRMAERAVDAEELADGVEPAVVRSAFQERALPLPLASYTIDSLLPTGGRAVLAGYRKAGKTTMVLNLVKCWANPLGGMFLGAYRCDPVLVGKTVVWLNLELTPEKGREWLHRLTMDDDTARNIIAVHMRGRTSRYAVTHTSGRKALTDLLRQAGADRVVIDPVAPLMASCGLDGSSPHDVAVFLMAMERVAEAAGVREMVYVTHVSKSGAQSDGDETAMGASRWEDAADAIWVMGKEKMSSQRWFKAEGRDVDVPEGLLSLDETTLELSLATAVGGRKEALTKALVEKVVEVVTAAPGIKKGELRSHPQLNVKGTNIDGAIAQAVAEGHITLAPGDHGSITHYATVSLTVV